MNPVMATLGSLRGPLLMAAAKAPSVTINFGKSLSKPSESVLILLSVVLLALSPFLLIMLTGFTRIVIVLGLTRSAMGITVPPNQVIVGLALFLSLFLMAPTLSQMNTVGLQPYLHGKESATVAFHKAEKPLEAFMLSQTGNQDLQMLAAVRHEKVPTHPVPGKVDLITLIPAFLLTQLESGFLIGFIIFVPFFIIDLIVSSTLMSMGIVMLPPTLISLPFKILLFVLVNGWTLVVHAVVTSFR